MNPPHWDKSNTPSWATSKSGDRFKIELVVDYRLLIASPWNSE